MQNNEILLSENDWFLEIDLNGGRIRELKYKENIILGTFQRIDNKTGNTHVCVPNFGDEGVEKLGLPFHGPFRNMEWVVVEQVKERLVIEGEINKLKVTQEFVLTDGFEHKVKVENRGESNISVNIGIHNYWSALNGWDGLKINNQDMSEIVKNDDYFKIDKENIILLPGGVSYKWILEGLNWARLWTGRCGEGESLMFDHEYVCIEPVIGKGEYFGSEESILKSGGIKEVIQKIGVV